MSVIREGKSRLVKVVNDSTQDSTFSAEEAEMDARAIRAVKEAIEKAKYCKMPIAKYDQVEKRAYVEYANGERKYVN